jgi:hypothetical protein
MPKLSRLAHLLPLLPLLFIFSASAVPFSTHYSKDTPWVAQDLSGTYVGRVYFGDKTGDQYIMKGPATLQILGGGKEFILTHQATKKIVKGTIFTAVAKNRPDLRAGEIKAQNDDTINIRWEIDRPRRSLKIVRATDTQRVFRFCTNNVTIPKCKIDL